MLSQNTSTRGKKRNQQYRALRDRLRNIGLETWIAYHHLVLERVEAKTYRRLGHPYRTAIRFLAELLQDYGVSVVYMGYPMYISQDSGNELTLAYGGLEKLLDGLGRRWKSTE